jgi:Tfp pilus assembly protein PilN
LKDGLQGITHDRILMRLVNYTQIALAVGGAWWGSLQIARAFERQNQQIQILQQQVSSLQQLIAEANSVNRRRGHE